MSRAAKRAPTATAFRCGPASIEVASDDEASRRWLHEFLTPWFASGPPGERSFNVRFTLSAAACAALERERASAALEPVACFGLDRQLVELPGWTRDGVRVIADRERSCFYRVRAGAVEIVAQPGVPRVRVGLLRVVRELVAARMLAQRGVLDLHAAAFGVGDRGVLLAGPKQSGKTTLLVAALAASRASLVANDRVFVDTREQPARAFGVPTLVSLRTGTLRWFPSLPQGLPERPALMNAAELAAQAGAAPSEAARLHLNMSPAQLAERLGASVAADVKIAAIVFPEISPATASWSLEPISREDGAGRLRESLYGVANGAHAGVANGAHAATAFAQAALGARRVPPPSAAAIARLAARIPLFRFRLGPHAYRESAEAWLRALPLEPARRGRIA